MADRIPIREVVCTDRERVEIVTRDVSSSLGPHQIEVESRYSMVSPGTETAIYSGTHIGYSRPAVPEWLQYPVRLGYCLVGQVARFGEAVESFVAGDWVLAYVSHADRAILDVRMDHVFPVPANVSPRVAAMAQLASISLTSLRASRPDPGDKAVVIGLGVIGNLAAQLFHIAGCRPVIGIDPVKERVRRAADCRIQGHGVSVSEAGPVVAPCSGDRRADVVVDATGNAAVAAAGMSLVEPGGCVVLLGSPRQDMELDVYRYIHSSDIRLVGAHIDNSDHPETPRDSWTRTRNVAYAMQLLADRSLQVEPLITDVATPEEMPAMYRSIAANADRHLGVLIDWREG